MATIKIKWSNYAGALEGYTKKDRGEELVVNSVNMSQEQFAEQLDQEKTFFHDESKVMALHVMQNFHPKESNLFEKERYNEMGVEFAKRLAPGHTAWVVTHLDRGHLHNHICISMIHSETGKRLEQSQAMIYRSREVSDQICKENGLSVLGPTRAAREARMPQKVQDMLARGRRSYFYDTQQKAEVARSATTGFDEYVRLMDVLGVRVHVEKKNIRYFYGNRAKPIRGKSLGDRYTKEGLMKAFQENDEKFARHPGLRDQIAGLVSASHDGKGNLSEAATALLANSPVRTDLQNKNYGKFTPIARAHARKPLPEKFGGHSILEEEVKKANSKSIRDYCKENKIALTTNHNGQTVIRGREFVVFESDTRLRNMKNRSLVTLVDLVSIHHDISDIQAVAKINGNPRLQLLEQVIGESKRRFKSFYVPKPQPSERTAAVAALGRLLKSQGHNLSHAERLLNTKNLMVAKGGSVWFLNEKGDSALELKEDKDGQWKGKRHGNPVGVFLESVTKSKRLVVFQDPFDFALFKAQNPNQSHQDVGLLVLFGEDKPGSRLDEILALHTHITEVHLMQSLSAKKREQDRQTFHEMKRRLDPFSIEVRPLEPAGLSKDRGRGPDFGL